MELFKKGRICIIGKFHRTDIVICSHSDDSREGKTLSYSQINTVFCWLKDSEELFCDIIADDCASIKSCVHMQIKTKCSKTSTKSVLFYICKLERLRQTRFAVHFYHIC